MTTVVESWANPQTQEQREYRYRHFSLPLMLRDLRFSRSALDVGACVPHVTLTDLGGDRVGLCELTQGRPFVLATGSLSCPMTASSVPSLNGLVREFGEDFEFISLYVREAHPAEQLPQPRSRDEKLEHARSFKTQLNVGSRVLVDDIDGNLHRLLDDKPNAAFVFDARGRLVFRSLWASDEAGLRGALNSVRQGAQPRALQSPRMLLPMLRALGSISETMTRAGLGAHRDLLLAAPPMELGGLLAGLLKPVPSRLRGPALVAGTVLTAAATSFLLAASL